jgi:hypothetical protein
LGVRGVARAALLAVHKQSPHPRRTDLIAPFSLFFLAYIMRKGREVRYTLRPIRSFSPADSS